MLQISNVSFVNLWAETRSDDSLSEAIEALDKTKEIAVLLSSHKYTKAYLQRNIDQLDYLINTLALKQKFNEQEPSTIQTDSTAYHILIKLCTITNIFRLIHASSKDPKLRDIKVYDIDDLDFVRSQSYFKCRQVKIFPFKKVDFALMIAFILIPLGVVLAAVFFKE